VVAVIIIFTEYTVCSLNLDTVLHLRGSSVLRHNTCI